MPAQLRITRSAGREQRQEMLATALQHLQTAREARDAAEADFRDAEANLMTLLSSHGINSATVPLEDSRYRVQIVRAERLSINEGSLRKAISAPVFDKLCDLKLNRTKLEEAIAEGRVDPVVVATYTTKTENRPFVKVSAVAGSQQ